MALLDARSLRSRLETLLLSSYDSWIYSAFITKAAAQWLVDIRSPSAKGRVLVRGRVDDVLAGACELDALELLISEGFEVSLSSALHAKIYYFCSTIIASSSNLTGSGLALTDNPNIEMGIEAVPSEQDKQTLGHLWRQAVKLDAELLNRMRDYIDAIDDSVRSKQLMWPSEIIQENRDLYCSDFPLESNVDNSEWNDFELFNQTPAYRWLLSEVNAVDRGCSFGFLSSQLHDALFDDPAPYRSEVKFILANLLEVVQKLDLRYLEVTRPRHSQVVSVRK